MTRHWLLPLAAAALTAGTAQAQRPIAPGEITRGSLTRSDPRMDDGTYYDEYTFSGRRGETVIVRMESDDFDTFLYLGTMRRGTFRDVASDDDGGDGTDSRIEVELPEDGTYVIYASSLHEDTGPYTLTLTGGRRTSGGYDAPRPVRPGRERNGGPIRAGRPAQGYLTASDPTLDGGEPFHLYTYSGRRGERVTIDLRSTDFDSYLVLGTAGGRHGVGNALARDDDGGGNRNSRIDYVLPYDGEFVIRVNPLASGVGRYELLVRSDLQGSGYSRPDEDFSGEGIGDFGGNGGYVESGRPVEGYLSESDPTLDDGHPFHLYTYEGRRGERLVITLRSDEFDPYLVIGTPGGRHGIGSALARDDDGGGGRNSRIEVTLPSDGEYVIRVNPMLNGTGRYVLDVRSRY